MDVTAQTFPYHLPRMLEDLASSTFVAIDLEFSGIVIATQGRAGPPQSLQQRYREVKEGADNYQILQVGLTFCHEDTEKAKYTMKPYNLYLSPIIDRKLEVERNWSFQSSAIEFLLDNKFNMDSLYRSGVPYISREEEEKAVAKAIERQNQTAASTSLDVKETDHESLAFLQVVRQLVDKWLALGDKREKFLNIPPPTGAIKSQGLSGMPSLLNRFQKRLVHQLIEVEYSSLVTIGRPTFVQIIDYDEDREKAVRDKRVQWVRERAWRETGFRWVAEALSGGDLSNLCPSYFNGLKSNSSHADMTKSTTEFANDFKERLKTHRPILVGHNLFMDLIYFFRCFFGPLPDQLEDFQSMVHKHFPVLIDTKYLATHDCGSINPTSSLKEINDELMQLPTPMMSIHPHFARYNTQKTEHEAGYDSLLTAQVFIKLSAQLNGMDQVEIPPTLHVNKPPHTTVYHDLNNRFSQLQIEVMSEGSSGSAATSGSGGSGISLKDNIANGIRNSNKKSLIPKPGSQFWTVYGNKLRVFGTVERVCEIG